MAVNTKSNEIQLQRIYNAPVKVVWEAWTDADQAAQWWGPRGFSITTHSKDLRPGGHWKYTMHGPDGVEYANTTKYLEVEENSKLVYDHGGNDEQKPLFRVTAKFTEKNGQTHMDMRMALPTAEAAEQTRKFVKQAGGDATWDRLAEYLEKRQSGQEKFVINRSFAAPVDRLFDIWTTPSHLAKWLAPSGTQMEFLRVEIKPGGGAFYRMFNDSGMNMFGKTEYIEIEKPKKVVYKQQFADENGGVARHPMAPTWPETMHTLVEFTPEGPDQTRITITWTPVDASPEELQTFVQARGGMTQGWTGSFDKLDSYLEETIQTPSR